MSKSIKSTLIAPCGMNCALCKAYIREKNPCPGCNEKDDGLKPTYRTLCRIRNCETIKASKTRYCFICDKLPCARLKQLDKRYRTKYGMSMIENLENIKKSGIRKFIEKEKKKWACPECGKTLCVHIRECTFCGLRWRN